MALARTDIVCEKCGNTFTYRKKCANDILANVYPDIIRCNQEEAKVLLEFKNFGREAKDLFDFEKLNIEEADFSTKERLKSDFSENKS